jgi:hypothetical protein
VFDYARCNVTYKLFNETYQFGLIANATLLVSERVENQTIFFNITTLQMTNITIDNPHNVDIEWFTKGLNSILQFIANTINIFLAKTGFPLPKIDWIDFADIEEIVKDGYIEAMLTPTFKFPAEFFIPPLPRRLPPSLTPSTSSLNSHSNPNPHSQP